MTVTFENNGRKHSNLRAHTNLEIEQSPDEKQNSNGKNIFPKKLSECVKPTKIALEMLLRHSLKLIFQLTVAINCNPLIGSVTEEAKIC